MRLSFAAFFAARSKLETFPRPLGIYRKYIQPSDVVHDFGKFKLIRARPTHVPLLINSFKDFQMTEPMGKALNFTNPPDEVVVTMLHNVTRYPFSFFAVNRNDEIVGLALQDVVYKDNEKDPRPRHDLAVTDPSSPMNVIGSILSYGEQKLFELTDADKYLQFEVAYVPSSLRRQRISSTMNPVALLFAMKAALKMGIEHNVAIITGSASLGNMMKLDYKAHERIPESVYVGLDGKRFTVEKETAMLVSMNMVEVAKKKKVTE